MCRCVIGDRTPEAFLLAAAKLRDTVRDTPLVFPCESEGAGRVRGLLVLLLSDAGNPPGVKCVEYRSLPSFHPTPNSPWQTAGAGTGFLIRQLLRNEKLIPDDHEEPPIEPLGTTKHVGTWCSARRGLGCGGRSALHHREGWHALSSVL
jgi:hypothetical protein